MQTINTDNIRTEFSTSADENIRSMKKQIRIEENFDILTREIIIGGKKAGFFFIDGFVQEDMIEKLMQFFYSLKPEDLSDVDSFLEKGMPYTEVNKITKQSDALTAFFSGVTVCFIDGFSECLSLDCRTYPMRSVTEPWKDKVLRGSRDGFVETLVLNAALLRRRIRDPQLSLELMGVGTRSRSDVAVCYMEDKVDKKLLDSIKKRIQAIRVEALTMNIESLAECLYEHKWINPFPKFKFTERPDTAVACLLEGKVIILVDNSPSAMILPTSILDMIEEANDYYFPTVTGMYLKVSRAIITILTVFMTPVYLLFMMNPSWIPSMFEFTAVRDVINVPLVLQFLILELCIDGLRLAALNTPSMLSTPLSVIAGLVLGEFAVQSGWFNSEVMLYMAFVAVANYTQPNFEMGYALKFMRLMLLVLTALFDWVGFLVGCLLILCFLACNKTLSGRNYLNIKLN